jgi:hypothetical protein
MFGSMKDYVIINDPAPLKFNGGMEQVKMYDAWFAKKLYDPHITNGESPMMYLPPKEQLARIRRI